MRSRPLLTFSVPLAAAGTLAGHAAGYALVGSSSRDAAVHGYLTYAPQFLAVCISLVTLSLGLRVSGRLRGRPSAWPFALLPPLAFCTQELVERLAVGLPAHTVLEPAVYVGLAAQLPVAVLAFLAARTLLGVADEAARTLAPRPLVTLRPGSPGVPAAIQAPGRTRLMHDRLGRAPPPR